MITSNKKNLVIIWRWGCVGGKLIDFNLKTDLDIISANDATALRPLDDRLIIRIKETADPVAMIKFLETARVSGDFIILYHLNCEARDSNGALRSRNLAGAVVKYVEARKSGHYDYGFYGGSGSNITPENYIYYKRNAGKITGLLHSGFPSFALEALPEELPAGEKFIKKSLFDDVWEYYSNEETIRYRNKISFSKIWTPLVIDISGLYNILNEGKDAEEYFQYIKKIYNFEKIIEDHNKTFSGIERLLLSKANYQNICEFLISFDKLEELVSCKKESFFKACSDFIAWTEDFFR